MVGGILQCVEGAVHEKPQEAFLVVLPSSAAGTRVVSDVFLPCRSSWLGGEASACLAIHLCGCVWSIIVSIDYNIFSGNDLMGSSSSSHHDVV